MEKKRKRNEEDFCKGKISKEAKSKSVSLTAESVAILPAQSSNQLSPSSQETSKKTNSLSVFNDNPANASNNSEYRLTVVCDDDPNNASLSTSDNKEKANENNSKSATTLPQQLTSDPSSVELHPKKKESKDDNDINKTELFEKYEKLLSDVAKTMETRGRLFPAMWYRNASTGDWIKHTPYDNSTSTIEYFSEEEKESYRIWFKKITTEVEIAEVTEEIEIPADIDFSQLEYVRQFYPDPMPLMPAYREYQTRLKSFNILSNTCIEEIELLAKLGFYFLGCHCLPRPVLNVRSKDLEAYNYDSAACFCCGIITPIFYKYPRPEPAAHYLHCKLKLPKDKQYMKDSVIPLTKKDELDFHFKENNGRPIPCREEQKWFVQETNPTKSQSSFKSGKMISYLIAIITVLDLFHFLVWMFKNCGNLVGFSPTVSLVRYTPTVIVVCTVVFSISQIQVSSKVQVHFKDGGSKFLIPLQLLPKVVFVLEKKTDVFFVYGHENIIPQLFQQVKEVIDNSESNDRSPLENKNLVIYGLATSYSASFIAVGTFVFFNYCFIIVCFMFYKIGKHSSH